MSTGSRTPHRAASLERCPGRHRQGSLRGQYDGTGSPRSAESAEKSVHNIVPIVAERAVGPGPYELSLVA